MSHKSHKRGTNGSRSSKTEKRKSGISKEEICILYAIDRADNIIT